MKSIFLVISAMFFLSNTDCSKTAMNINLNGTWKLKQTSGGFAGRTIDASADSVYTILFNEPSYKKALNGNVYEQGNFSVTSSKSIYSGNMEAAVTFHANNEDYTFIATINKDTLVFADNHFDGFSYVYTKQ